MKYKIKTKRLSDGTLQVGYNIGEHWTAVCNLIRLREGYKTDRYAGWKRTITEWKQQIEEIFNERLTQQLSAGDNKPCNSNP